MRTPVDKVMFSNNIRLVLPSSYLFCFALDVVFFHLNFYFIFLQWNSCCPFSVLSHSLWRSDAKLNFSRCVRYKDDDDKTTTIPFPDPPLYHPSVRSTNVSIDLLCLERIGWRWHGNPQQRFEQLLEREKIGSRRTFVVLWGGLETSRCESILEKEKNLLWPRWGRDL